MKLVFFVVFAVWESWGLHTRIHELEFPLFGKLDCAQFEISSRSSLDSIVLTQLTQSSSLSGHSGSRLVDWHQLISDNQLTSCKSKGIDHCGAECCGIRWRQDESGIIWMRSLCFEGLRKFTFYKRSVCSTESQIQFEVQFEIVLMFMEGLSVW